MNIIICIWTNITDKDKAAKLFTKIFADTGYVLTKSEIYWKDNTKRQLTFEKNQNDIQDFKNNLFPYLTLVSPHWTRYLTGLSENEINVNGHSNNSFKHNSISFATVINESN